MLRSAVRAVLPVSWRERAYRMRKAANFNTPMILAPTYAEDGLISQHVCGFMGEPRFEKAYAVGANGADLAAVGGIRFRAHQACWAAEHALKLDGDFVECGVFTGILSLTFCTYTDFAKSGKTLYLYDTFKGIPVETLSHAGEIASAKKFNAEAYTEDTQQMVRDRFRDFPNVVLVPGVLPASMDKTCPEKIAYLSIDLNNAPAEIGVIEKVWDRIVPGGVILLDDYAYGPEFANQKTEWDKFAKSKGYSILTLGPGQGLLIK